MEKFKKLVDSWLGKLCKVMKADVVDMRLWQLCRTLA